MGFNSGFKGLINTKVLSFYIYIYIDILIYLLTAVGLSPGGSIHLHTNSAKNNTNNNRTTQIQQYRQEWTGRG